MSLFNSGLIGRTLSERYIVVEEIGRGGMGVTYKAVYSPSDKEYGPSDRSIPTPGNFVVIKSAKKSDTAAESLRRERTLLTIFNRQNVPGVPRGYDNFESDGNYYTVMEFIDGTPMSKYIEDANEEGRRLSEKLVAKWGYEIADTLVGFSHLNYDGGLSVIHDDIKPANIIIDKDGNAIVADFGCARKWNDARLDPDSRVGTPGFSAPERRQRVNGSDLRSDVYSLGATLYTALTGEVPNYPLSPMIDLRGKRSLSNIMTNVVNGCMQLDAGRRMRPEVARDMLRRPNPYTRASVPQPGRTYTNSGQHYQGYDVVNGVLGKM